MSARFRLVQFMPDPFAGTKVTVGALVEVDGRVEFARAPSLPSPRCVGGRAPWTTMHMIMDALSVPERFDLRSGEISSLAGLTAPRPVPPGVSDARAWVETFVLPQRPTGEQDHPETAHRQRRDALGYRFFQQWKVARYVKRKFKPGFLGTTLPQVTHDISHYVPGSSELLLMEPILGTRANLGEDLKAVSESFLAYRALLGMSAEAKRRKPTFVAYVLTGGYAGAVAKACEVLSTAADSIVNVDDPAQREPFLLRIAEIGRSGGNQGAIPLN